MKEQKMKYLYGTMAVIIFYLIVHFVLAVNFGDDIGFRKKVYESGETIFNLVYQRWFRWSSRTLIEIVMFWVEILPNIVWKILDIGCIGMIFYIASHYTEKKLILMEVICSYPFFHMGSAGWIATTTNYLWPFVALLICYYIFDKAQKKKWTIFSIIAFLILYLYAISSEILSVFSMCVVFIMLLNYKKGKSKDSTYKSKEKNMFVTTYILWMSFLLSVSGIINCLLCPGNQIRIEKEVIKWMPEFYNLSMFDKVRLGVVSVIQHFTSIPNIPFFVFNLVLMLVVWKKKREIYARIISMIPIIINVLLSSFYFVKNIVIKHYLNYEVPKTVVEVGTSIYYYQIILFIIAWIYLIAVLYSFLLCFNNNDAGTNEAFEICMVYLLGLFTRLSLVFSPILIASGTRTYFMFYVVQGWITVKLSERLTNMWVEKIVCFLLGIGAVINIVMVYLLRRNYS